MSAPALGPPFRLRGQQTTRLEGFSDAVFGFALTLLVVSLEAPRTFAEFQEALSGLLPFTICFAIFLPIWLEHHTFFRRYALGDPWTVLLNSLLLFVVLAYVYPLKFLFSLLSWELMGALPSAVTEPPITLAQMKVLMYVYGVGFAAIAGIFALFYANALRQAERLELTALERHDTVTSIAVQLVMVTVGLASIAAVASGLHVRWAGLVYFAIGPAIGTARWLRGRGRAGLAARLAAAADPPSAARPTPADAG